MYTFSIRFLIEYIVQSLKVTFEVITFLNNDCREDIHSLWLFVDTHSSRITHLLVLRQDKEELPWREVGENVRLLRTFWKYVATVQKLLSRQQT